MASKEIIFAPNAERGIKELSTQNQKLVIKALKAWACGANSPDIEKIKSQPSFYRFRVGSFRVIYYPLTPERVVLLVICDRKAVYRCLDTLPQKLQTALRKLKIAGE